MKSFISTPIRCSLVLLIVALLVSGCSGSSDSNSGESQADGDVSATNGNGMASDGGTDSGENEMEDANTGDTTSGTQTESTDGSEESTTGSGTGSTLESEGLSTTRVDFDIIVPVYSSNTLQVRLDWGDIDTTAIWDMDQHWTASADFPVNTTNQLVVTFSDDNGAVTLGSFETSFTTGTNQSESVQITADEFDTDRWDSDGDGISNLSEAIAGTNPQGSDALEPVQASLELVQDKTFRLSWQAAEGAEFYRIMENPDSVSGFSLISGDLDSSTLSFDHRVALYNRVNARYIVQACNANGCVDSDTQIVTGTLVNPIGYFKASNTDSRDWFGNSISLSADGTTLAVGATDDDSVATGINADQTDNSSGDSGAVYVFTRSNGPWQQQAYIKASNTDAFDRFGAGVSLSADGNTLAVGATAERSAATGINGDQTDNSAVNAGAVYVFARTSGLWQQQAYVKASNTDAFDGFGSISISLSADGNTLAVGARSESSAATGINGDQTDNSAELAGAVYVFTRTSRLWQQQAYVKASNTDAFDHFGTAVSLSADGNTLAVGATAERSAATGINGDQTDNSGQSAGAVYVYTRTSELWQQQAYVKASNYHSLSSFGVAVSLSADGNTLAVGARGERSVATGINGDQTDISAESAGAVYVFTRNNELWQQQAYVKASNTGEGDGFGGSVSLSADGTTLAVGAFQEDSVTTGVNGEQTDNSARNSGAVYVFVRNNVLWRQQAYIKASNQNPDDLFGVAVSLSADGNTLAVGARGESSAATGVNGEQTDNSVGDSGAVYLY